eukprot:TRINITY_DN11667_c0_g1_i2.p2 TRINITY_DN11667_c0_g1~~TRINITY_DN11667_c0_g1_i2.p2  ORF type:complete len:236 (-),score=50.08 TRINITY_DN11667_c0_g1_i2:221-928(-)
MTQFDATTPIRQVLKNIRAVLGLEKSLIVVAFDGLQADIKQEERNSYKMKIQHIKDFVNSGGAGHPAEVLESDAWMHQANTLRRAKNEVMKRKKMTPILYSAQDDSDIVGEINTSFIVRALLCDDDVESIRFFDREDCDTDKKDHACKRPVKTHSSGLMQYSEIQSDRPHFALTNLYERVMFPRIPTDDKKAKKKYTPEQYFYYVAFKRNWVYGARNEMLHEKNLLHDSENMERP